MKNYDAVFLSLPLLRNRKKPMSDKIYDLFERGSSVEIDETLRERGFSENLGAAMGYQFGPMASRAQETFLFDGSNADENYDFKSDLEGYENFYSELSRATSEDHAKFIKSSINNNLERRQVLEDTSWYYPSQLIAGTLDLANLPFYLPVVGQMGLVAKSTMTMAQAAKASAKGGLAAGVIAETYRAPFDPLATKQEVLTNLITTTAFGTIIGSVPSAYRNFGPALRKSVHSIKNIHTDTGSFKDNMYEGTTINSTRDDTYSANYDEPATDATIVEGPTGKYIGTRYVPATYVGENNTIYIDVEYIAGTFADKPWTKPKVKGVKALDADEFLDADEWVEFVRLHEIFHTINKKTDIRKQNPDVPDADFDAFVENLMNSYALAEIRTRRDKLTTPFPVKFDAETNTIHVNDERIDDMFDEGAWVVPDVEGATPLRDRDINSPNEYKNFLIHQAKLRSERSREPGETSARYNDRINKEALDRTYKGHGQDKNVFTNSFFYKMITSPGKRILLDDKIPDIAKRTYNMLAGGGRMATERNMFGDGTQSVEARSKRHEAKGLALLSAIRQIYDKQTSQVSKFVGATSPLIERMRAGMTFDEFFAFHSDRYIRNSEGSFMGPKQDFELEVDGYFNEFFKFYREFAEDTGAFKSSGDLVESLKAAQREINRIQAQTDSINGQSAQKQADLERMRKQNESIEAQARANNNAYSKKQLALLKRNEERIKALEEGTVTPKQQQLLDLNEKRLARLREEFETLSVMQQNGMVSDRFYFPIYYDKQRLKAEPEFRERFKQTISQHIEENPELFTKFYDEELGRYVDRETVRDPAVIADEIVDNMIDDNVADLDYNGPPSSKSLRSRQLNIPEWKVAEFTIKTPEVILHYARQMGNRLEYRNRFGRATIDDLLDDAEYAAIEEGKMTESEIAQMRRDITFDYERVLGIHLRNPERLDARMVRIIQDIASVAFLGKAGIASVTDAGNIILQHGFQKSFDMGVAKHQSQGRLASLAELEKYVVGLDLAVNGAQQRVLSDTTTQINPNSVERVFNSFTGAFYNIPLLGNNLGFVTRLGKRVDAPMRMNQIIEGSINYTRLDDATRRDLAKLGIDEMTARKIAQMPFEEVDGFFIGNMDAWPSATKLDRELKAQVETALNIGVGNSILMANISERPILMDGVLYVEWHPWMEAGGFVIDERVSTKNIKYTRLESKAMGMPFQFMSYSLAATAGITGAMFDPYKKHRLIGMASLIGLGYVGLQFKHEDWWFENRSKGDLLLRSIDASGVPGIYGELAYTGIHALIGGGIVDTGGKYKPTGVGEVFGGLAGAGPGLMYDYARGLKDLFDGGSTEQAERLKYSLPILPLFGMKDDVQDLIGDAISGK